MEKENNCVLKCGVTIENLSESGMAFKSQKFKTVTIAAVRNQFRELFFTVQSKDAYRKFLMKDVAIHKKFVHEGKATIKFPESRVNILISNAPATQLSTFIKVLFIKISSSKCSPKVGVRDKLLSNLPTSLQEISPVNTKDINRVKERQPGSPGIIVRPTGCKTSAKPNIPPATNLSAEQKKVLDAVLRGSNVFFTGSAGTGKSYLLRAILNSLPPESTVVTASTGAAACLIGGVTLHSFAGIGTGEGSLSQCRTLVSRNQIAQNWKRCKHLIIDEISMIDSEFYEKVEWAARQVRATDRVFGGIQLIICGDFLQLPPVKKSSTRFCFVSPVWEKCAFETYQLKTVHRQSDSSFIDLLNDVRFGIVSAKTTELLQATGSQMIESSGVVATRLCSHTEEARQINASKLSDLPGEERIFESEDIPENAGRVLDECTPVAKRIILKVGAQVMLLKNLSVTRGLVNGARGVVEKFVGGEPVVKFVSGETYSIKAEKWSVHNMNGTSSTRKQLPLKLAWAFSIHKSQGLTLDCVEMNLSKTFEAGQAYVALSRAKSLQTLRVINFQSNQVWADPTVLKFYKKLEYRVNDFIPLGKKQTTIMHTSRKSIKFEKLKTI